MTSPKEEPPMATLEDLVKSLSQTAQEEQLELIRDVRRNRYEHRPALEKRKRKARKKKVSSASKLISQLSKEDLLKLAKEHGIDIEKPGEETSE